MKSINIQTTYELRTMHECRAKYTQPITICFVLMFVFFPFSSFFYWIRSQLFKMTKSRPNAYRTALTVCAASDEHRMTNTLGAVCSLRTFRFDLIQCFFVLYGHNTRAWRDDDFFDLVDICTPKNSVRFHIFVFIAAVKGFNVNFSV